MEVTIKLKEWLGTEVANAQKQAQPYMAAALQTQGLVFQFAPCTHTIQAARARCVNLQITHFLKITFSEGYSLPIVYRAACRKSLLSFPWSGLYTAIRFRSAACTVGAAGVQQSNFEWPSSALSTTLSTTLSTKCLRVLVV